MADLKVDGVKLIAKERQRQIDEEDWSAEHDDGHTHGSLALAAICFASPQRVFLKREGGDGSVGFVEPWPWENKWDKRREYGSSRERCGRLPDPETYNHKEQVDLLVKAGALIAAEIDRLLRIGGDPWADIPDPDIEYDGFDGEEHG